MERDAFLQAQGIRVLRFENYLVMEQLPAVLEAIQAAFGEGEMPMNEASNLL